MNEPALSSDLYRTFLFPLNVLTHILLTEEGDVVLDPFAGSNTTGAVAERLQRRWIAVEKIEPYLEASKFRFS